MKKTKREARTDATVQTSSNKTLHSYCITKPGGCQDV